MEITAFIQSLPPAQQVLCHRLHALCTATMPEAHAMVYHSALGYSPTPSPAPRVVYVAPQTNWVNLGFFYGGYLPDPEGLLIGKGKRMRHIKIRTEADIDRPAIVALLKAAWEYEMRTRGLTK